MQSSANSLIVELKLCFGQYHLCIVRTLMDPKLCPVEFLEYLAITLKIGVILIWR